MQYTESPEILNLEELQTKLQKVSVPILQHQIKYYIFSFDLQTSMKKRNTICKSGSYYRGDVNYFDLLFLN